MKNSEIKISIIVPIYNAEKFLVACVNSVQEQIHSNLQVILVDDGSTDGSSDICEQLANKDTRIEVYHTENKGSVAARKFGLKRARGDYVGFVDADDTIESDMFSELLHELRESGADFVHSGYIEEGIETQRLVCNFDEMTVDMSRFVDKTEFLQRYILNVTDGKCVSYSLWSKLFKKELITKCLQALPDEQQYGEDLLCLCRCILESRRITLSRYAGYHYIVRKHTLSHLEYETYMQKEISLWHYFIREMEEYRCLEILKRDIYDYLKKRMLYIITMDKKNDLKIPHYYYKNVNRFIGKRIVLFGAGDVGQDYYAQISKYKNCKIVAWADSNWKDYHFDYAEIIDGNRAASILCDMIIIAVKDRKTGMEIKELLEQMGVPADKIDWQAPGSYY